MPDHAFGPDVPYTPRHEDAMTEILDDLEQEGVLGDTGDLDDPNSVSLTEVGARILEGLAKRGMLRDSHAERLAELARPSLYTY